MARVLVTRAPHQASALADALTSHGLEVVSIPTIAIAPPSDSYAALDRELIHLDEFAWILFTSANAVEAFAARLDEEPLPAKCRIASIGAATSTALRAAGFAVRLQAPTAVAESLAAALAPHAKGAKMFFPRAEAGRDVLVEKLTEAGAEVTMVPAYRTVIPPGSAAALRQALPSLNAVTFASSSAVQNFFALLAFAGVALQPETVLASIGPVTTQTLGAMGITPQVEAPQATVASLASALAQHLR